VPRAATNGIELYYEELDGSPYWLEPRTPVLFIHGLSTDHTIWEKQVAVFVKERPVVNVDVRGHGRSDKPEGDVYEISHHTQDIIGLLRHLGYPKVHVVGVSMGGMVAQQLALRVPELLASITLVCSTSEPAKEGATLEWRLGVFDKAPTLEGYYGPVFERGLGKGMPAELRNHMYELAIHNPRALQRTGMIATFSYDSSKEIGRINLPTLVVGGQDDGSIPVHLSEQLAKRIPNARLEILPACGHAPYFEAPEALSKALREFISQVDAQRKET
jgi:pimeloyl-ACP methyl ester carboxylesterase